MKDIYTIRPITKKLYATWLKNHHYAKRIPIVLHSFGLFETQSDSLLGVCTFGPPPRTMNDGKHVFKNNYTVNTLELNRLIIKDNLPKNTLSFFLAASLKLLPTPSCVVSYSDFTFGHNGYIYQATNWTYTGLNTVHSRTITYDGVEVHTRTATARGFSSMNEWAKSDPKVKLGEYSKKHRYFKFLGSKRERAAMLSNLIFPIKPYPKGDNTRYDTNFDKLEESNINEFFKF